MSLSKTQQEFALAIAQLINFSHAIGVQLTFGDAYRDPRLHGARGEKKGYGARNSCHKLRLAVDFNVFVDGEFITDGEHEKYKMLGEEWEMMHPLARWGGRFSKGKSAGDANHFSFEYNGFK
jgi:hypothetical protein